MSLPKQANILHGHFWFWLEIEVLGFVFVCHFCFWFRYGIFCFKVRMWNESLYTGLGPFLKCLNPNIIYELSSVKQSLISVRHF